MMFVNFVLIFGISAWISLTIFFSEAVVLGLIFLSLSQSHAAILFNNFWR